MKPFAHANARDLKHAFPDARGFSARNLFHMRLFFHSYRTVPNCADASAQLPWSPNLLILKKIDNPAARSWYLREAARNGWSVRVLRHQIETDLYRRQALTAKTHNFRQTLPPARSDLAEEMLLFVDDVVDELGSRKEVESIRWILDNGSGADRQLAVYRESGEDLKRVVDFICDESAHGIDSATASAAASG